MKKFKVYASQTVLIATEIEAKDKNQALDLLEGAEWEEVSRENNSIEIEEV